jgi:hypothetical protein
MTTIEGRTYHRRGGALTPCAIQDGAEACALCEADADAREAGALGGDGPPLDHECLLPAVCGERDPISTYYGFGGIDDMIRCANAPAPEPEEPDCATCAAIGTLCPAHERVACTYGCPCTGACTPDPGTGMFAGPCRCPCHKTHQGRALEDGTFANCECGRWTVADLVRFTEAYWAESGQLPPPYALRAARRG